MKNKILSEIVSEYFYFILFRVIYNVYGYIMFIYG